MSVALGLHFLLCEVGQLHEFLFYWAALRSEATRVGNYLAPGKREGPGMEAERVSSHVGKEGRTGVG